MEDFLAQFFNKPFQTIRLPQDGGHRVYFRISVENSSYILMSCGEQDPSLKVFLTVLEKLKQAGLPVPKIFEQDLKKGLLLLEDLGSESLESIQNKSYNLALYQQALTWLIRMQEQVSVSADDEQFDSSFFRNERDIAHKRLEKLSGQKSRYFLDFSQEIELILTSLNESVQVYCHRDFHSKNLMVREDKIYFLDFQDAGVGPYCYDLCSLIYDSYVTFSDSQRTELLEFYFKNLGSKLKAQIGSVSSLNRLTDLQFLQRGHKACGCFAFFYLDRKQSTHIHYIKPTIQLLEQVAFKNSFKASQNYFQELGRAL